MLSLKKEYQKKCNIYILTETRIVDNDMTIRFIETYNNENIFLKEIYFRPLFFFVNEDPITDKYYRCIDKEDDYGIEPNRDLLKAIKAGEKVYIKPGAYNAMEVDFFDSNFNLIELTCEQDEEWVKLYNF